MDGGEGRDLHGFWYDQLLPLCAMPLTRS